MEILRKFQKKRGAIMGYIKGEDIRGVWADGKLYCKSCIKDDLLDRLAADDFVLESQMDEEDFYFCDQCLQRL